MNKYTFCIVIVTINISATLMLEVTYTLEKWDGNLFLSQQKFPVLSFGNTFVNYLILGLLG